MATNKSNSSSDSELHDFSTFEDRKVKSVTHKKTRRTFEPSVPRPEGKPDPNSQAWIDHFNSYSSIHQDPSFMDSMSDTSASTKPTTSTKGKKSYKPTYLNLFVHF